jgi:hypothetical protein
MPVPGCWTFLSPINQGLVKVRDPVMYTQYLLHPIILLLVSKLIYTSTINLDTNIFAMNKINPFKFGSVVDEPTWCGFAIWI